MRGRRGGCAEGGGRNGAEGGAEGGVEFGLKGSTEGGARAVRGRCESDVRAAPAHRSPLRAART